MNLPTHTLQIYSTPSALELRGVTPPKILLNFEERRTQHARMVSRQCSKSLLNPIYRSGVQGHQKRLLVVKLTKNLSTQGAKKV